jgi:hypothetical protein
LNLKGIIPKTADSFDRPGCSASRSAWASRLKGGKKLVLLSELLDVCNLKNVHSFVNKLQMICQTFPCDLKNPFPPYLFTVCAQP